MALLNRVEPKDRGEFSGRTTALALGVGGEAGFGGILARGAVIVALCIGGDACGGRPFSCRAALALVVRVETGLGGILARAAVIVALCIRGDACGGRPFSCRAALALGAFELNSALPLPGAALYTLERAAAADATAPRAAAYGGGDGATARTGECIRLN